MVLLDTNACIAYMRGSSALTEKCLTLRSRDIYLCSIVQAELWHGIYAAVNSFDRRMPQVQEFFAKFPILPFDEQAAQEYGKIKALVEPLEKKWKRQGQKFKAIGDNDILIAAIACSRDFVLVSRDSDFDRISNLRRENWEED